MVRKGWIKQGSNLPPLTVQVSTLNQLHALSNHFLTLSSSHPRALWSGLRDLDLALPSTLYTSSSASACHNICTSIYQLSTVILAIRILQLFLMHK